MNKTKRNNKTIFLSIVLFISICISACKGDIISQTLITAGLDSPNVAQDVIFYNDNLIVVVGIEQGSSESQASLIQYDSNGAIVKQLSFPISGEEVEVEPLNINENLLYIIVYNGDGYGITFDVFVVDLETLTIVDSTSIKPPQKGEDGHTPNLWLPFSASNSYWQYENPLGLVSLFSFSHENLTEGTENLVLPLNGISYGGATNDVAEQNLIFACGFKDHSPNANVYFPLYNVETKEVSYQFTSDTASNCGVSTFIGDSSQVVFASNIYDFYSESKIGISVFDVLDSSIPKNISQTPVLDYVILERMYADQSNIFIFGNVQNEDGYWQDQNSTLFQIQYNQADNSFTVIDSLDVPEGYRVVDYDTEHRNPIISYSLGSKQLAIVLETSPYFSYQSPVLLVNYS